MATHVLHTIDKVHHAGVLLFHLNPENGKIQILLVKGPTGKWGPPKGHLESSDSSVLAGAIREMAEETGIKLTPSTKEWSHFDMLGCRYFLIKSSKPVKPVPGDTEEILSADWFTLGSRLYANRHLKIINLIIPSLVYWFHKGLMTVPTWVSPINVDGAGFDEMLTAFKTMRTKKMRRKRSRHMADETVGKTTVTVTSTTASVTTHATSVAAVTIHLKKQRKPRASKSMCGKKWRPAKMDECEDKPQVITCKYCKQCAFLMVIHKEGGDYTCTECGEDYTLGYFCYKCRNKHEEDDA